MKARLITGAVALLFLAGCTSSPEPTGSSAAPSPSNSPSVSATPGTSPSASATPTSDALACPPWTDDPDSSVSQIGPNRFAGACLGMTFDEATANGTALTGDAQCPWFATPISDDGLGYYVNVVKRGEDPSGAIYLFMLKWFADPATAASHDLPATPEGITIGSTQAAVLAAYPSAADVSFNDASRGLRTQMVVSTGDDTTYNFDIAEGLVTEISWGTGLAAGGPNGDICAL